MKSVIDEVFYGIIEQLLEMGLIDLQSNIMDGTKIEANANKYSFVWRRSARTRKSKLQKKVKALLEQTDRLRLQQHSCQKNYRFVDCSGFILNKKRGCPF